MIFLNVVLLVLSIFILNKNARALEHENIIGGTMAENGVFNYHVTVMFPESFCGGAIVHPHFVVSAAHCVIDMDGNFRQGPFTVLAGVVDHNSHPPTRLNLTVDKIYVPNRYERTNLYKPWIGDISVLRLKDRIIHNFNMLEMPPKNKDFTWQTTIITGFGLNLLRYKPYIDNHHILHMEGYYSRKLHYSYVQVLSEKLCKTFANFEPKYQFCGQMLQDHEWSTDGVCRGDSGGPLVFNGKYLIGVLSSGPFTCDESTTSGVYTSVHHFKKFIRKALKDNCTGENMYCRDY